MSDAPVSDAVLADWIGVSARHVRELAERELVVKVGRNRFDLKASVARYAGNLRATAAGRSAEGDIDLVTERALLARQQRIGQEMKNEVTRGSLVSIDMVLGATAAQARRVRNKLLSIPSKVASRAAALRSAEPIRALFEDEVIQALGELTDGGEGHVPLEEARAAFRDRFRVEVNDA